MAQLPVYTLMNDFTPFICLIPQVELFASRHHLSRQNIRQNSSHRRLLLESLDRPERIIEIMLPIFQPSEFGWMAL